MTLISACIISSQPYMQVQPHLRIQTYTRPIPYDPHKCLYHFQSAIYERPTLTYTYTAFVNTCIICGQSYTYVCVYTSVHAKTHMYVYRHTRLSYIHVSLLVSHILKIYYICICVHLKTHIHIYRYTQLS